MANIRLSLVAAFMALVFFTTVKATALFNNTTYWYDATTNAYIGSTSTPYNPPAGCMGSLIVCTYGRAEQNPSAPIIAVTYRM